MEQQSLGGWGWASQVGVQHEHRHGTDVKTSTALRPPSGLGVGPSQHHARRMLSPPFGSHSPNGTQVRPYMVPEVLGHPHFYKEGNHLLARGGSRSQSLRQASEKKATARRTALRDLFSYPHVSSGVGQEGHTSGSCSALTSGASLHPWGPIRVATSVESPELCQLLSLQGGVPVRVG